mmetsp:Transcript_31802/g.101152  ORF Transcript_31802/g.101152 Transcript_31802/m.101152 type:complete len:204 (-) Transcript_31802:64-675(-)
MAVEVRSPGHELLQDRLVHALRNRGALDEHPSACESLYNLISLIEVIGALIRAGAQCAIIDEVRPVEVARARGAHPSASAARQAAARRSKARLGRRRSEEAGEAARNGRPAGGLPPMPRRHAGYFQPTSPRRASCGCGGEHILPRPAMPFRPCARPGAAAQVASCGLVRCRLGAVRFRAWFRAHRRQSQTTPTWVGATGRGYG